MSLYTRWWLRFIKSNKLFIAFLLACLILLVYTIRSKTQSSILNVTGDKISEHDTQVTQQLIVKSSVDLHHENSKEYEPKHFVIDQVTDLKACSKIAGKGSDDGLKTTTKDYHLNQPWEVDNFNTINCASPDTLIISIHFE